jgi:hypothetical protein
MRSEWLHLCGGAIRTSLVVGTLLTAINQGPDLLSGASDLRLFTSLLNYIVPFGVAIYSRQAILREITRPLPSDSPQGETVFRHHRDGPGHPGPRIR